MTWRFIFVAAVIGGSFLVPAGSAAYGQADPFLDFASEDDAYFAGADREVEAADIFDPVITVAATAADPTPARLAAPGAELADSPIDAFFLFACAALVLLMQAGFAMLEAGSTAAGTPSTTCSRTS